MDLDHRLLIAALLFAGIGHPARAEDKVERRTYIAPASVPSSIRQVLTAVGDRIQHKGLERTTLIGSLDRKGSVSTATITRELPGYLRIDETGSKSQNLIFDLSELKGSASITEEQEDLAEIFESDTAESFLGQLGPGATVRKLGDRFAVKGESGFGSFVDIYEVVVPVSLRRDKKVRAKQFMFDSETGLLRRVAYKAYQSGREVLVQTVYSKYTSAGGHQIPGQITRIADGVTVLTFTAQSAVVSPSVPDGTFLNTQK